MPITRITPAMPGRVKTESRAPIVPITRSMFRARAMLAMPPATM